MGTVKGQFIMQAFWNVVYFALGIWFGYIFGEPVAKFIRAVLGKD